VQHAAVLAADKHEQRRAGHARRVEPTAAIAQARRNMQIDHAERACGACITVRHRYCCDFRKRDDIAQLFPMFAHAHKGNLGRSRIAE
jgi:hypothetical protein